MQNSFMFARRTKIVCTIGPATSQPADIENLIRAGMDVARLNLSHGTYEEHAEAAKRIREISGRLGRTVAVLIDLPGPKYRVGEVPGGKIDLSPQDILTLATGAQDRTGGLSLPVNYSELARDVQVGNIILLADGAIELVVEKIDGANVKCRVVSGGTLSSRQGVVVPGLRPSVPFLSDVMRKGMIFAIGQSPDYVALSFVSDGGDISTARQFMQENGGSIPLIAKIEREEAVNNIDRILEVTDGIMVARGDLGIEIPLEKVPLVQKRIILKSNRAGRPVITATEMLESMITSPRPTRAETTDVANAIIDGSDGLMLSAETAVGKYPVQAVAMMSRIAVETEKQLPYKEMLRERGGWVMSATDEVISYAAAQTAETLQAAGIVAFTQSGSTARRVSRYRPQAPILALTQNKTVSGQLVLCRGVYPVQAPLSATSDELFTIAARFARETGLAHPGDDIIITAGLPIGQPGNTNMLKVEKIS